MRLTKPTLPQVDLDHTYNGLIALADWASVIHALMVRDVRSRFSGDPLGYGWAFVTPVVWIASIAIVFNFIGRTVPIFTDAISFLIAGMLPYTVFRTTISSTMKSLKQNKNMLYFAQISKLDILIAGAFMEFINAITVYVALVLSNYILFSNFELADPIGALFGFSLAWALGVSFGHLAVAFTEISDATNRVVPILLRPMFWISGIFFVANEMPDSVMGFMKYNPLLQAIEIMRDGVFLNYTSRITDVMIPILFIVGMNAVAIVVKMHAANTRSTNTRRIV